MSAEGNGNGLSLEGLAQRLQALERENERMRSENAELRSKVAKLKGSDKGRAVEEPASSSGKRRMSRSGLPRNAGAAAVDTMAAGALRARDASVANAAPFAPGISVDFVVTHLETAGSTAVLGDAPNGEGVVGFGKTQGVRGEGKAGVVGKSSTSGWEGVYGQHTGSGYGVVGDGSGDAFAGVLGRNTSGLGGAPGVRGEGQIGVYGRTTQNGNVGVQGTTGALNGYGVRGIGKGVIYAGVYGSNSDGSGVRGSGTTGGIEGRSIEGFGVSGTSQQGYAGNFEGGKAQLRIVPKSGTGRPTSGSFGKGDLYMDSAAALFVCVADGTPGTWRRVQTVAA